MNSKVIFLFASVALCYLLVDVDGHVVKEQRAARTATGQKSKNASAVPPKPGVKSAGVKSAGVKSAGVKSAGVKSAAKKPPVNGTTKNQSAANAARKPAAAGNGAGKTAAAKKTPTQTAVKRPATKLSVKKPVKVAKVPTVKAGGNGGLMLSGVMRAQKELNEYSAKQIPNTKLKVNNLASWTIKVRPTCKYYRGYILNVSILLQPNYPITPPEVKMEKAIFHPYVEPSSGKLCLLKNKINTEKQNDGYTIGTKLREIIEEVVYMINNPSSSMALNAEAGTLFGSNKEAFGKRVTQSLKQLAIEVDPNPIKDD